MPALVGNEIAAAIKPFAPYIAIGVVAAALYFWVWPNYIEGIEEAAVDEARTQHNEQVSEKKNVIDREQTAKAARELADLRAEVRDIRKKSAAATATLSTNWHSRHQREPDFLNNAQRATNERVQLAQESLERAGTPVGEVRTTRPD